ncbi:MAG: carboxypeptidase [Desulfobacteraceae bacterium]|nr:carboxypeptidase [Desulfobacteraceae bacterium]
MKISKYAFLPIVVFLFSVAALPLISVNPAWAAEDEEKVLVHAKFPDFKTARKALRSFETIESDYSKGYLVMKLTHEEMDILTQLGFLLEEQSPESLSRLLSATRSATRAASQTGIPGYECYRTVEETFAAAQSIADDYPDLAQWIDAGDSWRKTQGLGGYDMMVLKLTNSVVPGPKPILFITAAIHAREYTTAELITRFAENLVQGHGVNPDFTWILDYHEVHMMLHTNPDGRKKAEAGQLWRKNTNENYCSFFSSRRGADLNRNFSFSWGCCGGSSNWQCDQTYRGNGPASEPEVQAVESYVRANFDDHRGPNDDDPADDDTSGIYLDIHSHGKLVLWPWGHTEDKAPNGAQLQRLGRKFAYWNGHSPEQSIGLYPTDGTTDGVGYGELGIASYTFELGTTFFEKCDYFEKTIVADNMPSLIYAAKVVRTPYLTPAGPDVVDLTVNSADSQSSPVSAGALITISATINDTRYNNSNGTEPAQQIRAAEYYVNTPAWEGGLPKAMTAGDGTYNTAVEHVKATIDTTGMNPGQHIVFVRGQDADDNWGAFSAVFLYIQ